jgi:hypothetical protein
MYEDLFHRQEDGTGVQVIRKSKMAKVNVGLIWRSPLPNKQIRHCSFFDHMHCGIMRRRDVAKFVSIGQISTRQPINRRLANASTAPCKAASNCYTHGILPLWLFQSDTLTPYEI